MESKILDVYWLIGINANNTIGIVAVKNNAGDVTFRIAQAKSKTLSNDVAYIKDHGLKFNIDGLVKWIKNLENRIIEHPFNDMKSIYDHFNPIYEKRGYTCSVKTFELRKLVWINDVHAITLLASHDYSKINISTE